MIEIDTREKPRAISKIVKYFDNNNIQYISTKLYVGDYRSLDNPRVVVDRKQNLTELVNNVTQGHARFKAECLRANVAGIKLIILCEHSPDIKSLEDVKRWRNPRLQHSPKATTGQQLYKILSTMKERYNIEFLFCHKGETGKRIAEILKEVNDGNL